MGKSLLIGLLILSSTSLFSQEKENSEIEARKLQIANLQNVEFFGETALEVADALYERFDVKTNRSVKNIRNVKIDGIDEPITLQIHRGYRGEIPRAADYNSACPASSYSHTFSGKRDKEWFEANKKSNETYAVKVYFKRGSKYGVASNEEYEAVLKFLISVYST
jgi:hypothetical protein